MTNQSLDSEIILKDEKTQKHMFFLITVLMIYPLPQMAIDIYLPSWPNMSAFFGVHHHLVQLSLTIYILFLGFSQILYGVLCDFYSRKKLLMLGISLFIFGCLGCFISHNIWFLIASRVVQAIGLGCGFTIASTLLADAYTGKDLARVLSYSAMVYALSLILAPVVGSFIEHYLSWQDNFFFMIFYALALLICIQCFVHLPDFEKKNNISLHSIFSNYLAIMKSTAFWLFCLCLICGYGVIVVFNLLGPFLLMEKLHVSVMDYGFLLFIVGLAYFLGSWVNGKTLDRGVQRNIFVGIFIMIISAMGLLVCSIQSFFDLRFIVGLVAASVFSVGFIYPNCFSIIMDLFQGKSYVSSLVGSLILLGVSAIGSVITSLHLSGLMDLSLMFISLSVFVLVFFLVGLRLKSI